MTVDEDGGCLLRVLKSTFGVTGNRDLEVSKQREEGIGYCPIHLASPCPEIYLGDDRRY